MEGGIRGGGDLTILIFLISFMFYDGEVPKQGVISSKKMKVLYKGSKLRDLECSVACTAGN